MKKKTFSFVLFIWVISHGFAQAVSLTYTNPVWEGYLADPFTLEASYRFYCSTRIGLNDTYFENNGESEYEHHLQMLKSKDIQNWELAGGVLRDLEEPFIRRNWALEAAENGGRSLLFNAADNETCFLVNLLWNKERTKHQLWLDILLVWTCKSIKFTSPHVAKKQWQFV
ncbi:glycoside hydrolase family protein [Draconibacterium sediminis]|uniref:Glycosyl hydrolase family 32 N-terminal domain-containing protein n=1 Tax=Draconibacterium sediminis TaxID=1544798 RepID=A0A0D8JFL4_9BACT|nr:family 43 glycosylhydrolase [Draconibacterium sediminis]KJF45341.1 hypothetical protein LH29_08175 [Draconibacterium sediminis]